MVLLKPLQQAEVVVEVVAISAQAFLIKVLLEQLALLSAGLDKAKVAAMALVAVVVVVGPRAVLAGW
jgi:hypothetical protein